MEDLHRRPEVFQGGIHDVIPVFLYHKLPNGTETARIELVLAFQEIGC
jgi:hypothetical protein